MTKTAEGVSRTREGDPARLRRNLRGDLDNILLKALQKDRQAENLKIGHITAKCIDEYRRLGYTLEPKQLSDFGIHGVFG